MHLLVVLAVFVAQVTGDTTSTVSPQVRKLLKDIFSSSTTTESISSGLNIPGFRAISSSTTPANLERIQSCGEKKDGSKWICVNYDYCDINTNTVVEEGLDSGFAAINFRLADVCPHYLERCCKIPPSGLSPDFNPNKLTISTTSTTTSRPRSNPSSTTSTTTTTTTTTTTPRPRTNPNTCGVRNLNGIDFKLIGQPGNEADYGELPWMVAILKRYSNSAQGTPFSFCGGALLGPSVVITAAHCVYNYTAEDLKVRVGEWDSQTTRERLPYQERVVDEIVLHEQLVPAGGFYDFALLILKTPVDSAEHIGTICLPEQDQVIESSNCYVSGWGKDIYGEKGIYVNILKKIELPIVPVDQCQTSLRQTVLGPRFRLHSTFICAGGERGKDACTGDGGSPLVCPDPNNPNRYILAGLVSWGLGCGDQDVPGVYAAVAKARSWIDNKLKTRRLSTTL